MKTKEKLIFHCPDPKAKRRLAVLFGLEVADYLTWSAPTKGPLFEGEKYVSISTNQVS